MQEKRLLHLSVLLFGLCFGLFASLKHDGLWNWDEFIALIHIQDGRRLLHFGRFAYIYFYHYSWLAGASLLSISFADFHFAMRIFHMVLASLTIVFLFRILFTLTRQRFLSWAAAAATALTFAFIETAFTIGCDIPKYALVFASMVLFQSGRLGWAGFCIGIAFLVHEPALYFFAFFPLYIWWLPREQRLPLRAYGKAIGIMAATIGIPIIAALAIDSESYIKDFHTTAQHVIQLDPTTMGQRIAYVLHRHFNPGHWGIWVLLLWGMGVAHGYSQSIGLNKKTTLVILLTLALPSVAVAISTHGDALEERRFFLSGFALWAFYISAAAISIGNLLAKRISHAGRAFAAAGIVAVCAAPLLPLLPLLEANEANSIQLEGYFERLRPFIDDETVILLGNDTAMVAYRAKASGIDSDVIWPAWGAPDPRLVAVIESYLRKGKSVLYDSKGQWRARHHEAVQASLRHFTLLPVGDGLYRIEPKARLK